MKELTKETPKPMLKVGDKNLLELKLEVMPESVDEVIFVVSYLQEKIRAFFGNEYKGKKITYVEQVNPAGGTADALWTARPHLAGKFIVMMGDDLYSKKDIEEACKYEWSELVQVVEDERGGGATIVDEKGNIVNVEEGVHSGKWLVGTNMFVLDTRLFDFPMVPKAPGSSELGLPQTIVPAAKKLGVEFKAVPATFWFQITAPEDLAKAEQSLSDKQ
jgi:bifunctional UDP-N-acetylglucosamine pyrophosphorylase/glucosamine-1-phosphate N-acetyltransferase